MDLNFRLKKDTSIFSLLVAFLVFLFLSFQETTIPKYLQNKSEKSDKKYSIIENFTKSLLVESRRRNFCRKNSEYSDYNRENEYRE